MLTSDGANHLWQLDRKGSLPEWQEEIDVLMEQQIRAPDYARRKHLFDRVQQLFAEHLPMLPLVCPHVLVGAAEDVANFSPAVLDHFTLWNVDELYWRSSEEP